MNHVEIRTKRCGRFVDVIVRDDYARGSDVMDHSPGMTDLQLLDWVLKNSESDASQTILNHVKEYHGPITIRDRTYLWDEIAHLVQGSKGISEVDYNQDADHAARAPEE